MYGPFEQWHQWTEFFWLTFSFIGLTIAKLVHKKKNALFPLGCLLIQNSSYVKLNLFLCRCILFWMRSSLVVKCWKQVLQKSSRLLKKYQSALSLYQIFLSVYLCVLCVINRSNLCMMQVGNSFKCHHTCFQVSF